MPKKTLSELIAIGFQEGYEQAIQEFLQGHAEGFAAGFFQESEANLSDIKRGRMFELAFAEGFIAGNQAFQLSKSIDQYEHYCTDPIDEDKAINLSEEFGGDDYAGEEGNEGNDDYSGEEENEDKTGDDYPDIGDEKSHDYLWMDT